VDQFKLGLGYGRLGSERGLKGGQGGRGGVGDGNVEPEVSARAKDGLWGKGIEQSPDIHNARSTIRQLQ
jgi:hypothetical protein